MAKLPPLDRVDPAVAWEPWKPDDKDPFNLKWAGHLYRRATFGGTIEDLRTAVDKGLDATLEELLKGDGSYGGFYLQQEQTAYKELAVSQDPPYELRDWWIQLMLDSQRAHPFLEKMTLFWHNHFATSIAKVLDGKLIVNQNKSLRRFALTNFPALVQRMTVDPALLYYLDSNSNVKGSPNENYARELMELFSLGVGNYTETDVKEAARAFTGWHVEGEEFQFKRDLHDDSAKTVLGKKGYFKGDDIARIVLEQPACATFLVKKLYRSFISESVEPPDALIKPLADSFRKSGYDVTALMSKMLRSRFFYSEHAFRQRIKSPVEFIIGTARIVNFGSWNEPHKSFVDKMESMGQMLLAPPNVKGWPGGKTWLNTSTILARHNFAHYAASGIWPENTRNGTSLAGGGDDPNNPEPDPKPSDPTTLDLTPESNVDVADFVYKEKVKKPEEIVNKLLDLLLQGGIREESYKKLVAFQADGNPTGEFLDFRIRETAHAIMTMPEYQLA